MGYEIDYNTSTVESVGETRQITVTAETGWTATTEDDFIHLSSISGESGETVINVTIDKNHNPFLRSATIYFVDDDDFTATAIFTQRKGGMLLPYGKLIIGTTKIN